MRPNVSRPQVPRVSIRRFPNLCCVALETPWPLVDSAVRPQIPAGPACRRIEAIKPWYWRPVCRPETTEQDRLPIL